MKYNRYQRRNAIKNYFPLPNEVFCLGLTYGELAVYSYLMYCENRKTYKCYPSYKTIGNAVGMSCNTVKKYVDGLIEKRLIEVEPTQVTTKHGRRNGNLCYTVRPIEETVRANYDRQMARLEEENRRQKALKKLSDYDRKHGKKAV